MGLLRVGIDARGMSASGGEAHAALGLVRGLLELEPLDAEFLVAADPFAAHWLEPHLKGPFRLLASPAIPHSVVALDPREAAQRPGKPGAAGVVLANEFVDAFPVHRLEGRRRDELEPGSPVQGAFW